MSNNNIEINTAEKPDLGVIEMTGTSGYNGKFRSLTSCRKRETKFFQAGAAAGIIIGVLTTYVGEMLTMVLSIKEVDLAPFLVVTGALAFCLAVPVAAYLFLFLAAHLDNEAQ